MIFYSHEYDFIRYWFILFLEPKMWHLHSYEAQGPSIQDEMLWKIAAHKMKIFHFFSYGLELPLFVTYSIQNTQKTHMWLETLQSFFVQNVRYQKRRKYYSWNFFSCFSIFLSFWFCFSFYYLTHVNVLLTALEYPASNHIVTILLYLEYFPSHASRKHFLLALCKRLLNCRCVKCVGVLLHPHTHRVCVLSLACVISMDLLLDHFLNLICTFRAHFCALYAYIYMGNWLWILKSIGIYNKIK